MTGRRAVLGLLALIAVSVVLAGYLTVGVLKMEPLAAQHTIRVDLERSGGLQPNSTVLLNGIEIGRVTTIETSGTRLRATLKVDADQRIPADAVVRIANLSLVGEQYVEFSSASASGPYLDDGAVVVRGVDPGVSVADMLTSMRSLTGQFDPHTLEELARTFTSGWEGRDQDLAVMGDFSRRTERTIGSFRSEFTGLFENSQELLKRSRADRIGPILRETAPKLAHMNVPFATLWSLLPGLATATEGAVGWYDVIIPFTQKLGEYMSKMLPDAAAIVAVLQPKLAAVAPAARMDLAAMVAAGLQVIDENGVVRLRVAPPR